MAKIDKLVAVWLLAFLLGVVATVIFHQEMLYHKLDYVATITAISQPTSTPAWWLNKCPTPTPTVTPTVTAPPVPTQYQEKWKGKPR